jgi:hypothetical protein
MLWHYDKPHDAHDAHCRQRQEAFEKIGAVEQQVPGPRKMPWEMTGGLVYKIIYLHLAFLGWWNVVIYISNIYLIMVGELSQFLRGVSSKLYTRYLHKLIILEKQWNIRENIQKSHVWFTVSIGINSVQRKHLMKMLGCEHRPSDSSYLSTAIMNVFAISYTCVWRMRFQ